MISTFEIMGGKNRVVIGNEKCRPFRTRILYPIIIRPTLKCQATNGLSHQDSNVGFPWLLYNPN